MKPQVLLHLRIQTPSPDAGPLLAFLKEAVPFYQAPGGIRVRLLQSTDDPTRFIETVEYETRTDFESDQRRIAEDVRMKAYIERWRALLAGPAEVEVYHDITARI